MICYSDTTVYVVHVNTSSYLIVEWVDGQAPLYCSNWVCHHLGINGNLIIYDQHFPSHLAIRCACHPIVLPLPGTLEF